MSNKKCKVPPIPAIPTGPRGLPGTNGLSAYEIALKNGFVGTEQDWLLSLKGNDGDPGDGIVGPSAYQVWLSQGNVGTEQDFLDSLKGDNGTNGTNGVDGLTAYQIAVQNGFQGTVQQWLQSLVGPQGVQGPQGIQGEPGIDGVFRVSIKIILERDSSNSSVFNTIFKNVNEVIEGVSVGTNSLIPTVEIPISLFNNDFDLLNTSVYSIYITTELENNPLLLKSVQVNDAFFEIRYPDEDVLVATNLFNIPILYNQSTGGTIDDISKITININFVI